MKKTFIIAIAFFMSVSASPQMKYGIKAGLNVSQFSGIDMGAGQQGGSGLAYGFNAGVFANYSFSHLFGFQPEVVFSMQGGTTSTVQNVRTGGTDRFNYINVPLLLEFKPLKSRFSFLAGPQFGYCVSRSFVDDAPISNNSNYKDFDFAIAVGIQYALTKQISLGLRYNHGLVQSLKYDYESELVGGGKYTGTAKGERNNVLQLSLGWTF